MLEFTDFFTWKTAEAQHRIVESQHPRIFCIDHIIPAMSTDIFH